MTQSFEKSVDKHDALTEMVEQVNRKPHIILVDDDDIIRMVIKVYLDELYQVDDFSHAQAALDFLEDETISKSVDMVVSDINMPDIDGLMLRDKLNDFEALEAVPFIFLTGESDDQMKQKAKALGIDDFIHKPVKKDELLHIIEPILKRREQVASALGKMLDHKITDSLKPMLPETACGFNLRLESQEASTGGGDLVLHIPHKDFDYVIVADVMGHGVEAKFFAHAYAGYIYGLMRSFADSLSVEGFLERLNKAIYEDSLLEKSMLTVVVAQLFRDGRVVVGTAGHPSPLIATRDGVYEMDCDGMLLGALDISTYESSQVDLSRGGRMLLFSDGLIELPTMLEDPDGVYSKIAQCMQETREKSLDDMHDRITCYYKQECHSEGLRDDVTYVTLEFDPAPVKKSNNYTGFKKLY